jgi:flagellar motor switch/type III secretory pathway protein FliN
VVNVSTLPMGKQGLPAGSGTGTVMKHPSPGEMLPWLPCTLALEVAVVGFTVGSLLKLVQGSLVQTSCHQSMDIPLQVNGILMAWTEFEVVGERLAARITDLV